MTDANKANWYSDGEKAARRIEDLLPMCDRPDAGDAADEALVDGREVFLPIFLVDAFSPFADAFALSEMSDWGEINETKSPEIVRIAEMVFEGSLGERGDLGLWWSSK